MSEIHHSFIGTVYSQFLAYEGTEWGDQLRALCDTYQMGEDCAGLFDNEMDQLQAILLHHLEIAHQQGWLDGNDPNRFIGGPNEYYQQQFTRAIETTINLIAMKPPNEATLERIPAWMRKDQKLVES